MTDDSNVLELLANIRYFSAATSASSLVTKVYRPSLVVAALDAPNSFLSLSSKLDGSVTLSAATSFASFSVSVVSRICFVKKASIWRAEKPADAMVLCISNDPPPLPFSRFHKLISLHYTYPKSEISCFPYFLHWMADHEQDHGFIYDDQGQDDILNSPFFDINPEVDSTVEEYVERIVFTLAAAIDD
ncbi:hypothetical protein M5K25_013902 [Dendrobium thyrsiflorum]|uniref:Uncharacterized protein n=1 Tax=Dendrobium thyrsiflorum TaxID=117978 RepID=A0ABD0UV18_DENTH